MSMIINEDSGVLENRDRLFSIIIYLYNCDVHIEEAIDSVINQTIGFEENVQLILVDDGSEDDTYQIAQKYERQFPDNIVLISQDHLGIANAYNQGLDYACGKYVNFMESFDYLDLDSLREINKVFSKNDLGIINMRVQVFAKSTRLRRKLRGVIDLDELPNFYFTYIYATFFKRDVIGEDRFNPKLIASYDYAFLSKILIRNKKFMNYQSKSFYNFRKRGRIPREMRLEKAFYLDRLKYFLKDLIDYSMDTCGKLDQFIKLIVLRELIKFVKNKDVLEILSDSEVEEFFDTLKYILSFFENEEISEIYDYYTNSGFFIAVKNGDVTLDNIRTNTPSESLQLKIEDNNVLLESKGFVIEDMADRKLVLDFVTLRDDVLSFSGHYKSTFDKDKISVSAIKEYANGEVEIIDGTYYHYPTRSTAHMMNFDWQYVYNFDLLVPIKSESEVSSIKLMVYFDTGERKVPVDCEIKFRKYCNMSYASHYYVKDNRIVMFNGKFNVMPYSYSKMFRYEMRGLAKVLSDRDKFFIHAMVFRLIHLIFYPYMRSKEIWIVMDRKEAADDNGEHFYKYAIKQNDGIKKYFSIFKESDDFKRLNDNYGNILDFESFKHKFYYIFTDKLISSQGSEFYLNPFRNRRFYLTAGITNLDFYFLQHGIIKDNMSSWLRKYDRNPKLIVTSTQLEYESLFDEGYNYGDKVITLLGLPRYDNLNNQGYKKQIVIMPSWRNFLKDEKSLLNSEYFHRFNSLVNNERLIEHAKEKGYEIVFKPHPELVRYLELFDKNDYVQIDQFKKYQVIFNESAVLVTDYSSIFFDFSYLKKPLIYYQYGNDYHYDSDNGYFQYETMGFGPVIKEEDELVDKLIEYMDTGCVMEDVYKERVDKFFKYHDHNNSKRCYDWIMEH